MKHAVTGCLSVVRKNSWYQALFLAVIILAIYSPTIGGEVSIVDDRLMIDALLNGGDFSLKNLFFPQSENGGYYRPLIGLSFFLDKMLWFLDERMMHLENILLHTVNVLLVFFLTRALMFRGNEGRSFIPFLAAMVFGIHPLATESVNWISGRTDLLAGTFVLSSALMLVKYRLRKKLSSLLPAILFLFLGILSKEVALALVIAAPFLLWPRDRPIEVALTPFAQLVLFLSLFGIAMAGAIFFDNYWFSVLSAVMYFFVIVGRIEQVQEKRRDTFRTVWLAVSVAGLAVCGITLAVALRRLAFSSDMGKFGRLVTLMADDPNYMLSVFLGAVGFYVKKFFLPLPLNFFILEIDPLYDFIGIAVLLVISLLMARRTPIAGFFLAGACMLTPSLPLAFGTVAWTGYAERYVYIASAFWSVALLAGISTLKIRDRWTYGKNLAVVVCVATAVVAMASVTFTRNLMWRHNTAILADTVKKAPKAKTLRIMYAYALLLEKNLPEAKREADVARSLYSLEYDETVDIVTATILKESGKPVEAEGFYQEAVRRTKFRSAHALASIIGFYEALLRDGQRDEERVRESIVYYTMKQADLTGNPYHFYKLGQYQLRQGDRAAAIRSFQKARDAFSTEDIFKEYSERILDNLCRQGVKSTSFSSETVISEKRKAENIGINPVLDPNNPRSRSGT